MSGIAIQLGSYGWMHAQWNEIFYPEDLPWDWQLSYYSNEFNTVLVPASYWSKEQEVCNQKSGQKSGQKLDSTSMCEDWLDSVHDKFQFYVECSVDMLDDVSLPDFKKGLQALQPQLAGLVFLDEKVIQSASTKKNITFLTEELDIPVFSGNVCRQDHRAVYFQAAQSSSSQSQLLQNQGSSLALIENDLLNLRAAREIVEDFVAQIKANDMVCSDGVSDVSHLPSSSEQATNIQATIIVSHPVLSTDDLIKFRSVLEIMGL